MSNGRILPPIGQRNVFPKIKVTGGPSPSTLAVEVDGEPVDKIFELDIHAGVNEAISVKISQYVELAVEIDAEMQVPYVVALREPIPGTAVDGVVITEWREIARGAGASLTDAVGDLHAKLVEADDASA